MQANKMNTINLKLFIDTFGIVVLIFNSAFIVLTKLLGSFKLPPLERRYDQSVKTTRRRLVHQRDTM